MEAMVPVMNSEIPLKAHAHRADDIFTAIRIAKEFNLKLTLDHCTEGALIADELAAEGYPAFIGPTMSGISKYELLNKSFTTPATLYEAGVKIYEYTPGFVHAKVFVSDDIKAVVGTINLGEHTFVSLSAELTADRAIIVLDFGDGKVWNCEVDAVKHMLE
jgi:hypothetical protein